MPWTEGQKTPSFPTFCSLNSHLESTHWLSFRLALKISFSVSAWVHVCVHVFVSLWLGFDGAPGSRSRLHVLSPGDTGWLTSFVAFHGSVGQHFHADNSTSDHRRPILLWTERLPYAFLPRLHQPMHATWNSPLTPANADSVYSVSLFISASVLLSDSCCASLPVSHTFASCCLFLLSTSLSVFLHFCLFLRGGCICL